MIESLNNMEFFEVGDQPGHSIQKPSKRRSKKRNKKKAILFSTLFIILIGLTAGFITYRIRKNKIIEELKLSKELKSLRECISSFLKIWGQYFDIKEINSNKPYVYEPFKEKEYYRKGHKNWFMVLNFVITNLAYNFNCSDIEKRNEFFNSRYKKSWFPPIELANDIGRSIWGYSEDEYVSYKSRWLYGAYCLEEGVLGGADDYLKSCAPKYLNTTKVYCMSDHTNTIHTGKLRKYIIGGGIPEIIKKCTEEANRKETEKCYDALSDYLLSDRYLNYLNNGKQ